MPNLCCSYQVLQNPVAHPLATCTCRDCVRRDTSPPLAHLQLVFTFLTRLYSIILLVGHSNQSFFLHLRRLCKSCSYSAWEWSWSGTIILFEIFFFHFPPVFPCVESLQRSNMIHQVAPGAFGSTPTRPASPASSTGAVDEEEEYIAQVRLTIYSSV